MQPYDLIVIGSGPGGQRAAIQGAKAGKRVAIVEKQSSIGGVCINTGTIPSKTMREAVLHLSGFYDKNFYGIELQRQRKHDHGGLEFPRAARGGKRSRRDSGPAEAQWRGRDSRHGQVCRCAPHSRAKTATAYGSSKRQFIVIATGTKPAVNPKVPINGRNIINSDQILRCRRFRGL